MSHYLSTPQALEILCAEHPPRRGHAVRQSLRGALAGAVPIGLGISAVPEAPFPQNLPVIGFVGAGVYMIMGFPPIRGPLEEGFGALARRALPKREDGYYHYADGFLHETTAIERRYGTRVQPVLEDEDIPTEGAVAVNGLNITDTLLHFKHPDNVTYDLLLQGEHQGRTMTVSAKYRVTYLHEQQFADNLGRTEMLWPVFAFGEMRGTILYANMLDDAYTQFDWTRFKSGKRKERKRAAVGVLAPVGAR